MMVSKLDWFETLFPWIPVNLQKMFMEKFKKQRMEWQEEMNSETVAPVEAGFAEAEKRLKDNSNNAVSPASKSGDTSPRRRNHSRERSSRSDKERRHRSPGRHRSSSRE